MALGSCPVGARRGLHGPPDLPVDGRCEGHAAAPGRAGAQPGQRVDDRLPRRDAAFRAVPVRGDGASTRVYALESTIGYDTRRARWKPPAAPLDVALHGKAWLAVQALDGTEAYTRGGELDLDTEGQLVTAAACRCWAMAARSPCRRTRGSTSAATAASAPRSATAGRRSLGRLKLVTPEAPPDARRRRPVPRRRRRAA